ncbi:MAG TPA: hypothetical protein VFL94_03620 [Actinomycetales bacterium]|nr:hypothetical protein [Actinomycetales bacterium]
MTTLRLRPDLEDALRALPGVQAVSIVTTGDGTPTEVHVLAAPGKPAKQVVRDVQSLAMASFDLDIDHRIVSVVQIGEAAVPTPAASPDDPLGGEDAQAGRPVIASVSMLTAQQEATASVTIGVGDDRYDGTARGSSALSGRSRLVAVATIHALDELLGLPCEVESAQLVTAGAHEAALVVLSLTVPRVGQQLLSGSAVVRADPTDAIARAVLAALNRQLTT